MEPQDDRPIAREPWQRLLREHYEAPPEITDQRIRKAARRALAPRPARWWLPASLAASVLLAVVLVQSQFGGEPSPAVLHEADVVAPAELQDAPLVSDTPASATGLPAYEATPAAGESAATATAPADESRMLEAAPASPPPAEPAAQEDRSTRFGALAKSAAEPRTPEEWYEMIEALRAAGHDEEAEAELGRLEAAWPGWLEKNHPRDR